MAEATGPVALADAIGWRVGDPIRQPPYVLRGRMPPWVMQGVVVCGGTQPTGLAYADTFDEAVSIARTAVVDGWTGIEIYGASPDPAFASLEEYVAANPVNLAPAATP